MATKRAVLAAIGCLLAVAFSHPSEARVVRFVVEQTRSFAGGMSFGDVGPYQRLDGTAYMLSLAISNVEGVLSAEAVGLANRVRVELTLTEGKEPL